MTLDITSSSLEALENAPAVEFEIFPSEFISKLTGSIARCLDENSKPFAIRSNEPYEILFLEPAYVATLELQLSRPVSGAEIELSAHDSLSSRQVRKKLEKTVFSDTLSFELNCVTSGVTILLQPTIFELIKRRTLEIKRILVRGFTADNFETLSESLTVLQGFRDEAIEELSNEKETLQSRQEKIEQREVVVSTLEVQKKAELAKLEQTLEETTETTEKSTAKLTELKDEISRIETRKKDIAEQASTLEATTRRIDGEISKGKEQLRAIAVETADAERHLRELTNNINLFPEEFSSFSDHGAKQIKTFIGLSAIPLIVIALLTGQLLWGAVDLSVKYIAEPNLDLVTIFVTRLPYLAVCGSILAVSYATLRFLFSRISIIYAERLDFAKIGIVAKDVAFASSNGLSLADEQIYEARTYLKIEMLKAYLSGNIGAFVYKERTSESNNQALLIKEEVDEKPLSKATE